MDRIAFVLACFAVIVLLQVFLSKMERKWPGLVLVVISLLLSFLYPLSLAPGTPIVHALLLWLLGNIPTVMFLAIYVAFHPKRKQMADEEE